MIDINFLLLSIGSIPFSISISIIIATIFYNANYYLKTKTKYLDSKIMYLIELRKK